MKNLNGCGKALRSGVRILTSCVDIQVQLFSTIPHYKGRADISHLAPELKALTIISKKTHKLNSTYAPIITDLILKVKCFTKIF